MDGNSVDVLYQAFANHGPAIQAALLNDAVILFGALAVIEVTLVVGRAVAHKTDTLDIIYIVANQMITVGFFLFLLQNWANFAKDITDSFGMFGARASTAAGGTATMMPVGMIMAGANMAKHCWEAMSLRHPFQAYLLYLDGVVVACVFAYFAALMVEVLIECFFASYIGVVMMAFGGNTYTRDMAISQGRYAISVGVKRLTMQMIAGISELIVDSMATRIQNTPQDFGWLDVALMLAIPIVIIRLASRMPNIAQDVVMGSHISGQGSLLTAASSIAKAATALATSVAGGGAAIAAGARVAATQMAARQAAGTVAPTRMGQAAQMVGMAASATGKALATDVGRRLTGQYSAAHGYRGFRMAAELNAQANGDSK